MFESANQIATRLGFELNQHVNGEATWYSPSGAAGVAMTIWDEQDNDGDRVIEYRFGVVDAVGAPVGEDCADAEQAFAAAAKFDDCPTVYVQTDFADDVAQAGGDARDEALVESLRTAWTAAAKHMNLEAGAPRGCADLAADLWQLAHDALRLGADGYEMHWSPERLRAAGRKVRAAHRARPDGTCSCEG